VPGLGKGDGVGDGVGLGVGGGAGVDMTLVAVCELPEPVEVGLLLVLQLLTPLQFPVLPLPTPLLFPLPLTLGTLHAAITIQLRRVIIIQKREGLFQRFVPELGIYLTVFPFLGTLGFFPQRKRSNSHSLYSPFVVKRKRNVSFLAPT